MTEDLTLLKLRTAFERAEKKFQIMDARYKQAIKGVYMLCQRYDDDTWYPAKVEERIIDSHGGFSYGYATDFSEEFGKIGRNGRFYESVKLYYKLKDLEYDREAAKKQRDRFLIVCNAAGIKL